MGLSNQKLGRCKRWFSLTFTGASNLRNDCGRTLGNLDAFSNSFVFYFQRYQVGKLPPWIYRSVALSGEIWNWDGYGFSTADT